jgi:hydroxymethylbilane synthase
MKIGTRGSKLALIQAQKLANSIKTVSPETQVEIIVIQTSGDWKPSHGETLLSEADGGKGLFAKEIELALLDARIDVGIHSLKDVPTFLPRGLSLTHTLERDDPRDAFICEKVKSIDELPEGAIIGTSSLRRKAVLLAKRADLHVVPIRGNVDTRLEKLRAGQVDAIILAAAGLQRMGLKDKITSYIEPESMLPAVCQGVLGMEIREHDHDTAQILDKIHHAKTGMTSIAERAMLAVLDGSCRTPIGSYGQWMGDNTMRLRGFVASPNGIDIYYGEETFTVNNNNDAHALGLRVGKVIKDKTPKQYLEVHG